MREPLAQREGCPFVVCLPRAPGKRESHCGHLFGGKIESLQGTEAPKAGASDHVPREQHIAQCEAEVARWQAMVEDLAGE